MARMMGTQQELDLLTSLLFTVSNEAQYKERVIKLQETTATHRQALDAAVKAKADAEEAVRNAEVALRSADQTMAARSSAAVTAEAKAKKQLDEVTAQRASLAAAQQLHEKTIRGERQALELAQHEHQSRVNSELTQMGAAKDAHQQALQAHTQAVAKSKADLLQRQQGIAAREAFLTRQETLLNDREDKISKAEADLTSRINKMRSLAAG